MPKSEPRMRDGKTVYLARVHYKGKKETLGYYDTEDEADDQIRRAKDRIKAGKPPWADGDGTPTLSKVVEEDFFPSLNAALKQSTRDDYRSTLKNILDVFGDNTVGSLTAKQINGFLTTFGETHSGNYLHKTSTRFYQVLGVASRKYRFINPMDDPDFTKPTMPNRSRVAITLTKEQTNAIVQATLDHEDHLWTTMFTVMLLTGVRRSELLGLTPDCWGGDAGKMTVHIYRQWDWDKRALVPNTKTEQGKRYIPIDDDLYVFVREWIDKYRPTNPKFDLLFPPPNSEVWTSESSWTRAYQVRLKWAGIKPSRDKSAHQFRHLYAATSLRSGVPIDVLSQRLGHRDNSFTLDRYIHILQEANRQGVDKLTASLVPPAVLNRAWQRPIQ